MLNLAKFKSSRVTWEGCSVLLDINDGDRFTFARLTSGSTLKVGGKTCSLHQLVGYPFGSVFEVEIGNGPYLSRVTRHKEGRCSSLGESAIIGEAKDNRGIVDNNMAQSLTGDDINAMKSNGTKGADIIEALIGNSASFEHKTSFSQDKYIRKKQKKYAPVILLRHPSTRVITEAYFKKNPAKIGFIRMDTMSLLLSLANVTSSSNVLILDLISGLLVGAVAERLGGSGFVCNASFGSTPHAIDIVKLYNFDEEICRRIVWVPIDDLRGRQSTLSDQNPNQMGLCISPSTDQEVVDDAKDSDPATSLGIKATKAVMAGRRASPETVELWKQNGFSSLIIAAPNLDPWSCAKDLLQLLSYSASFAIYHQYLQPLASCMHNMRLSKLAINLQISEPWLREYQVLPSRTHPCMQMSAFGGYILSGTRVHASAAPAPTPANDSKLLVPPAETVN